LYKAKYNGQPTAVRIPDAATMGAMDNHDIIQNIDALFF